MNPYSFLVQSNLWRLPDYLSWRLSGKEIHTGLGALDNTHHPDKEESLRQTTKFFIPEIFCSGVVRFFCRQSWLTYHTFSTSNFPTVDSLSYMEKNTADSEPDQDKKIDVIRMGIPVSTFSGVYAVNKSFNQFVSSRESNSQHMYWCYLPCTISSGETHVGFKDGIQERAEVVCCEEIRNLRNEHFIVCVLPYAMHTTDQLFNKPKNSISLIENIRCVFFSDSSRLALKHDFFLSEPYSVTNLDDKFKENTFLILIEKAIKDLGLDCDGTFSIEDQKRITRCFFYCHFRPYLRSKIPGLVSENHSCRDGIDRGRCAFAIEWLYHKLKKGELPTLKDYFWLIHAPAMQVRGRLMNAGNKQIFCDMAVKLIKYNDYPYAASCQSDQIAIIETLRRISDPKELLQKIQQGRDAESRHSPGLSAPEINGA